MSRILSLTSLFFHNTITSIVFFLRKKTCCKLDNNGGVTNIDCYRTYLSCKRGWGEKTD
jgi:hypothetical protein